MTTSRSPQKEPEVETQGVSSMMGSMIPEVPETQRLGVQRPRVHVYECPKGHECRFSVPSEMGTVMYCLRCAGYFTITKKPEIRSVKNENSRNN